MFKQSKLAPDDEDDDDGFTENEKVVRWLHATNIRAKSWYYFSITDVVLCHAKAKTLAFLLDAKCTVISPQYATLWLY